MSYTGAGFPTEKLLSLLVTFGCAGGVDIKLLNSLVCELPERACSVFVGTVVISGYRKYFCFQELPNLFRVSTYPNLGLLVK